jgi:phospholipid/cholesterol/gamma-HCH transport system substrate-binding protein
LAEGVRGQGDHIGEATTSLNEVLQQLNPRADAIRADFRSLQGFADTYSAAAPNILTTLDAASVTSTTVTNQAEQLDALLLAINGFSNSGINLLAPNKDNFIRGINDLQPTTTLLASTTPNTPACSSVPRRCWTPDIPDSLAGETVIAHRRRLVVVRRRSVPFTRTTSDHGRQGRARRESRVAVSLPDVAKNFPVRALVTNTGWGTGIDYRPNPGIVGRSTPISSPPRWGTRSRRRYEARTARAAPGPIPYPGAPAYGAPLYGPRRYAAVSRAAAGAAAHGAARRRAAATRDGTLRGPTPAEMQPLPTGNAAAGAGRPVTVINRRSSSRKGHRAEIICQPPSCA